jgi:hypothetical protein
VVAFTEVDGGAGVVLVGVVLVGVVFVGVVAVGFFAGAVATAATEPDEVAEPEAEVTAWPVVAEDVPAAAPAHSPSDAVAVITAEQEAR